MQISFPNKNILLKFTFVNKVNVGQHADDSIYISKMQNNIFQMIVTLIPFCLCQNGSSRNQVLFSNMRALPLFHVVTLQAVAISSPVCFVRISETRVNEFTYAKPLFLGIEINSEFFFFQFLILGEKLTQQFCSAPHLHLCGFQDSERQGYS